MIVSSPTFPTGIRLIGVWTKRWQPRGEVAAIPMGTRQPPEFASSKLACIGIRCPVRIAAVFGSRARFATGAAFRSSLTEVGWRQVLGWIIAEIAIIAIIVFLIIRHYKNRDSSGPPTGGGYIGM